MRTRNVGTISGIVLIVLGAWGALVPFIGSYFDWVIGSDETWDWSAGRFWLSVLPGVVTIIGGLLMLGRRRVNTTVGAAMALAAGAWFVIGPEVSRLWNDGVRQTGDALGGTTQQVFEQLTYFSVLGIAIAAIGSFVLGRAVTLVDRDRDLVEPGARTDEEEELAASRTADAPATGGLRGSGRRRRLRHRGDGRVEH